jgi:hypothetical protein
MQHGRRYVPDHADNPETQDVGGRLHLERKLRRRFPIRLPDKGSLTEQARVVDHSCKRAGCTEPFDIAQCVGFDLVELSF